MKLGINGRFYSARVTGVQRFARELCARLYPRCDAVLLVPTDAPENLPHGPVIQRGRLRGQAWEQLELPRMAAAAGCDLVLHPGNSAPLTGGPHAVVVHDVLPLTNPEWFSSRYAFWQRHVIRAAVERAAIVFAPSRHTAREIARTIDFPAAGIRVITQGLAPFDAPASQSQIAAVRARYGLLQPYFLAVGWGDPRKNIGFLFSPIDRLRTELADAPTLVVVGSVNRRIHSPAPTLPSWVRHVAQPTDAELHALYSGALALCSPALAEGFGRPPLEALACGTVAVVADYGPAREVLGDAATILPLRASVWLDALRRIAQQPETPDTLLQRVKPILAHYRWD
ncbi:MAG TPA: glycosyltransferase family 1 protein, partial [Longimicrobiales bacterium]|nr:glycosyltransferase family 1 protein [Longimicrobiales bacterium]